MEQDIHDIHDALLDVLGLMARPQPDLALIRKAGIALDRALFPLLVRIGKHGPVGIVDLSDLVGRDNTTVSRQVSKLESLGLVSKRISSDDKRVSHVTVSPAGQAMLDSLNAARIEMGRQLFSQWSGADRRELVRLLRKLVQDSHCGG